MKKILYLIVSGQTLFNKRKIIQGSCDSPLTESGKKQAKILSIYFEKNNIKFSHAYCSTQERASDTLEIITHNKICRFMKKKEFCLPHTSSILALLVSVEPSLTNRMHAGKPADPDTNADNLSSNALMLSSSLYTGTITVSW